MSNLRTVLAFALSAAVLTLSAAPASAAVTRVVSPSSTRTMDPCTTGTPCRLDYAMGRSVSRDDVSLLPGDYYDAGTTPWSALPRMPAYTSIHGTVGRPVPVIHGHVTEAIGFLKLDGAAARDLKVVMDTGGEFIRISGLLLVNNASAERVQVHVTNATIDGTIAACRMQNTVTLLDSVCLLDGARGYASALMVSSDDGSGSSTGEARNVTAVATGPEGIGIRLETSGGTSVLSATNVIARGRDFDVSLDAPYGTGTVLLRIDHSNFGPTRSTGFGKRELQQGPGNQAGPTAAAPLFVNEAAGDYRQAPGSPTIDAGAVAGYSPFDFAGDPRVIGGRLDIGGDEFFPAPAATTGNATAVGERVATLNGTVDPRGDVATVRFQYGPTAAYGSTATAPNVPAGAASSPVTTTLAGLSPATTYHYRVVATTARGGTASGADRTFRTGASPTANADSGSSTADADRESSDTNADGESTDTNADRGPGLRLDNDAAAISAVRIDKRWSLGSAPAKATKKRKTPVGTTIGFTLSKDATVTLEFRRALMGRSAAGVRGRVTVNAHAGPNAIRFRGRLAGGTTLRPGTYVLTVRARDAGGRASIPRRAGFTILP